MSSEIAIRIDNLGKCYHIYDKPRDRLMQMLAGNRKRYFREFWALRNVSFEVNKGETVGIIGRNGSGKSTVLQLICGILNPTEGSIQTHGRITALLELGSGFNPEFTGRENVYMSAAVQGMSKDEVDKRFDEIAAFADIGEFIEQPVKIYSSGMFVRLAFAAAVNVDPDILIVDEALSVGDVGFQRKCAEKLETMRQRGVTIFFASHDLHIIERICTRALFLNQGLCLLNSDSKSVVSFYQDLMNREEKKDRNPATAPQPVEYINSTREVEFLGLEMIDERGKPNVSFLTNETINIRIRYRALKTIEAVHFGISFWSGHEVRVGQAHSIFNSSQPIPNKINSDFVVECTIPKNKLMPGRYFLRGGIYDKNVCYPNCLWGWTGDTIGEFFIVGSVVNNFLLKDSLGYFLIDSTWKVID